MSGVSLCYSRLQSARDDLNMQSRALKDLQKKEKEVADLNVENSRLRDENTDMRARGAFIAGNSRADSVLGGHQSMNSLIQSGDLERLRQAGGGGKGGKGASSSEDCKQQ